MTDAEMRQIVDMMKKELPPSVWAHQLKGEEGSKPASWWVTRTQGITRRFLGAYSDNPPPENTLLQKIDDNVKKLLNR